MLAVTAVAVALLAPAAVIITRMPLAPAEAASVELPWWDSFRLTVVAAAAVVVLAATVAIVAAAIAAGEVAMAWLRHLNLHLQQ